MKKTLFMVLLASTMFTGGACFVRPRNDLHTHTFNVPRVKTPECRQLILDVLHRLNAAAPKGQPVVTDIVPDPADGTITVSFDTRRTALKNIEFAIAEAGFDVDGSEGRPAAKARLPEGCR